MTIIAVRSPADITIGADGRWPDSTRTMSIRISAADWYRLAAPLAIAFSTIASSCGLTRGVTWVGLRGSSPAGGAVCARWAGVGEGGEEGGGARGKREVAGEQFEQHTTRGVHVASGVDCLT